MPSFRRLSASPLVPLVIVVIAAAVQAALWIQRAPDRTMQVMSCYFIWPPVVFLLLLWWTFLSPVRWRVRLMGLGMLAMVVVAGIAALRFEGFSGDFRPMFSWRWQPSAEERANAYFHSARSARSSNGLTSDVAVNTRGTNAAATDGSQPDGQAASATSTDAPLEVEEGDWPQFRGPAQDGVVRDIRIRTDWEEHPPQALWRHPVGAGWSSFAVVDGLAFTQEQRGEEETVVCYELETGREVWTHVDPGRFSSALGGVGPLATPTVADSRVYTVGPRGHLNCLEARSGRLVWHTNILKDAGGKNIEWGQSGSPLIVGNLVIVNPGGDEQHDTGVAAYDRATGQRVWAAGRHPTSYTTPQLVTLDGVQQILIFDGDGVAGHDPETGRELWRFPWSNSPKVNSARPVVRDDGTILVSSSYGAGAALIKPERDGEQWKNPAPSVGWKPTKQWKLKFNDPVVHDGKFYGLDEGILACFDPETGRRLWKGGRYGYGQILLLAEQSLLLVLAEDGRVALVEATPDEFREQASFQAIDGKTWNHPVLVRGLLLVRNAEEAACYDLRP